MLIYSRFKVTALAMMAGMVTVIASSSPQLAQIPGSGSYAVVIDKQPRFRIPGGVEFEGVFSSIEIQNSILFRARCATAYLPWRNSREIAKYSKLTVYATFKPVQPSINPFNYYSTLFRSGVQATCKALAVSRPVNKEISLLELIRSEITMRVTSLLGEGERTGLFMSIALGARDSVSELTEQAFKKTGLAHLLVLSGAQVTLVFLSIVYVIRHISLISFATATLIGFLTTILFVLVTGVDGPSIRALATLFFTVSARYIESNISVVQALLFSMLMLSLIWPGSLLDPGVQLTYAALIGLCLGYDKFCNPVVSYLRSCIVASLATSAVSVLWFGSFSVIGIIINPILAPIVTMVGCNLGYCACIFNFVGLDPSGYCLSVIADLLCQFRDLVVYLSSWTWCSINCSGAFAIFMSFLLALPAVTLASKHYIQYLNSYGINISNINMLGDK